MKWIHILFELRMGGVASVIRNFAEAMPNEDSMILIVFRQQPSPIIQQQYHSLLNHPRVKVYDLKKRRKRDHVRTILQIRELLKKHADHVVISHLEEVSRYLLISRIGVNMPCFQVIHNDVFQDFFVHKYILKNFFNGYIFVSNSSYKKHISLAHKHMTWIVNGVEFKSRIQMDKSGWIFVGRMEDQKNPLKCLEFYRTLLNEKRSLPKLTMIGSGVLLKHVRDFIFNHNMESCVELIEHSSQIIELFAASSLAIMTSSYEGTPMVILEALSQGCPYIAYNVGGVGVVLNETNGYPIEPFNEDEFLITLRHILDHNHELELKQNAASSTIQSYHALTMVQNYTDWINLVMESRHN